MSFSAQVVIFAIFDIEEKGPFTQAICCANFATIFDANKVRFANFAWCTIPEENERS